MTNNYIWSVFDDQEETSIQIKETKSCKCCSAWAAFPAWRRLGDKDNRGEDNGDGEDDDQDNDDEDDDDDDEDEDGDDDDI